MPLGSKREQMDQIRNIIQFLVVGFCTLGWTDGQVERYDRVGIKKKGYTRTLRIVELHFENNGFGYYGHWIRPHLNHWMWIWIRTAGIAHLKLDTASAIKWSIPLVRPSWRQKVGWIYFTSK